jgi:subtilisin-like proprotein convertase family protein
MGNTIFGDGIVCKDDNACDYFTNPGKGPGANLAVFAGVQGMGTWKFCVGDVGKIDIGTIDSVTLTLVY